MKVTAGYTASSRLGYGHWSRLRHLEAWGRRLGAPINWTWVALADVPPDAPATTRRGGPDDVGPFLDADVVIIDAFPMPDALLDRLAAAGKHVIAIDGVTPARTRNATRTVNANVFTCTHEEALLCGPSWMVLPPDLPPPGRKSGVVVAAGGADPHDLVPRVLACIPEDLHVTAIVGPLAQNETAVRDAAGPAARVVVAPTRPVALLASAELAITAAGIMLYECAAVGTPAIAIPQVSHQQPIAQGFAQHGAAVLVHDDLLDLADQVRALLDDPQRRTRMGRAGTELVDGQGGSRIIELLLELAAA